MVVGFGCVVSFVVAASDLGTATQLSEALSTNLDSLARGVAQDLANYLPGLCSVGTSSLVSGVLTVGLGGEGGKGKGRPFVMWLCVCVCMCRWRR